MAVPLHERIGYTAKQAEALKLNIRREVAKIEDAGARLRRIVPGCDADRFADHITVDLMLEEFRGIAHGLSDVVDRQTRG